MDDKAKVRAWLFEMLALVEKAERVEGSKTEVSTNHVVLELTFK